MTVCRTLTCSALLLGCMVSARGDTFIETFSSGNEGQWTFGSPGSRIEPSGGNPGAYLRDDLLDTFAPQPRTGFNVASRFTGDYRGRRVSRVGVDLITHYVDFSADGRPLTVMLVSDNGTPGQFDDDWAAYQIGPRNIPRPGEGWLSYEFDIPSSCDQPVGWRFIRLGPNSPPNPRWSDVIGQVAQLRFFYGDPEMFFIFQMWDVGLDNARITTRGIIDGDLNGDGCVDQADLGTLLAAFGRDAGGDLDCDGQTGQSDLGILLANWNRGCE